MNTLSITLRHRPLRIGWCVEHGDFDALRSAMRYSFALWGGRYNPIIPVEEPLGESLVKEFRVDALYGFGNSAKVSSFIEQHTNLPWPFFGKSIFSAEDRRPSIADITHPTLHIHREEIRNNPEPSRRLHSFQWAEDDPLADMFLSTFGAFPDPTVTSFDYREFTTGWLKGETIELQPEQCVPAPPTSGAMSIAGLNRYMLRRHWKVQSHWNYAGFFVGNTTNFGDLVSYWNLRAADIPLVFHDPDHKQRLEEFSAYWAEVARETNQNNRFNDRAVAVWGDRARLPKLKHDFGEKVIQCGVDDHIWNGLNVRAPFMYFKEVPALASIEEREGPPQISFALADSPFDRSDLGYHENYVLSVDPGIGLFGNEQSTLHLPFLPQLNEYYGREVTWRWNSARAEPGSLGIITSITTPNISLRSASVAALIAEVMKIAGIEASMSKSGLVAANLIRQMGDLRDCRIFKIRGVRRLIEDWRPDQSFNRSCAKQLIHGAGTDRPLSTYDDLHFGPKDKLNADTVLSRLLDRSVFRAGLEFECPNCRQNFWVSLDHAKTRSECEYCGHSFNCSPQLKDKDWAFRRSGLFGRNDNQEGAVSVTLALQQLIGLSSFDHPIFTTATDLKPAGADIEPCETDFVILSQHERRGIEIAIGECKTRQPITEADVRKLRKVADAFPSDQFKVFIVFAKLAPFDADELAIIKALNDKPHRLRVIMFTQEDLETWRPYMRAEQTHEFQSTMIDMDGMAAATNAIFFEDRRKVPK